MKAKLVESEYDFRTRTHSTYNPDNDVAPVSKRRKRKIGKGRGRPPKYLKITIPHSSEENLKESSTISTSRSFTVIDSPRRLSS